MPQPGFSHHANVDKVFGENHKGEALAPNQISLNYEEIAGARATNYTWKVEEGEAVLAGNSDRIASFTPTTDLPDGDYYLQDTSDASNPKTLNFDLLGWT